MSKAWCYHRSMAPFNGGGANRDGLIDHLIVSALVTAIDIDTHEGVQEASGWCRHLGERARLARKSALYSYWFADCHSVEDLFLENELFNIVEGDMKMALEDVESPFHARWREAVKRWGTDILADVFWDCDWDLFEPTAERVREELEKLAPFASMDVLSMVPDLPCPEIKTPKASRHHAQESIEGSVYVIGNGKPPYKIGYTKHAAKMRLSEIQVGNPEKIEVIREWRIPNARQAERKMHKRLGKYRVSGEWFSCDVRTIDEAFAQL